MDRTLRECRQEIDAIDAQLAELVEKRLELCRETGRVKQREGLPVSVPEREAEVLRAAAARVRKDAYRDAAEHVFRVLMEESRKLQEADRS